MVWYKLMIPDPWILVPWVLALTLGPCSWILVIGFGFDFRSWNQIFESLVFGLDSFFLVLDPSLWIDISCNHVPWLCPDLRAFIYSFPQFILYSFFSRFFTLISPCIGYSFFSSPIDSSFFNRFFTLHSLFSNGFFFILHSWSLVLGSWALVPGYLALELWSLVLRSLCIHFGLKSWYLVHRVDPSSLVFALAPGPHSLTIVIEFGSHLSW